MTAPKAAIEHYKRMQRLASNGALLARRAWRSVDADYISESWSEAIEATAPEVTKLQLSAATAGSLSSIDAMRQQGFYELPEAFVNASIFASGYSAGGNFMEARLYSTAPYVKNLIAGGMPVRTAMTRGSERAQMVMQTEIQDVGRQSAGVDIFARPRISYTRMLNPPSCSRCVTLAGRVYRNNEGFKRHPHCDCIHVPTKNEEYAKAEGLVTDPYEYFESLPAAEQDKQFGKANAQAIRDGADISQVVNAQRGTRYAGQSADGTYRGQKRGNTTLEGTTKRGYYGGLRNGAGDEFTKQGGRYTRATTKRLTPEAIYHLGLPREQTLKKLKDYGYLLDQGQVRAPIRGEAFGYSSKKLTTAAQDRLTDSRLSYEAAAAGRNPYGKGPVTPDVLAQAEKRYRQMLATNGEIFTQ